MYYGSVPLHNKQFTRNVFREIYFYWKTEEERRDTVHAQEARPEGTASRRRAITRHEPSEWLGTPVSQKVYKECF